MDLIISHNACPDGWAAAYIAKKRYPEAEILLLNHGIDPEPVINQCVGKNVIMLDYSLRTRELNDRLNSVARTFHIYDHHKTAEAVLAGAEYATFDMKRSGAGLAWDYLFGGWSMGPYGEKCEDRPWWVDYTEDRDLWNWALPASEQVNAYLNVQIRTMEAWNVVASSTVDSAILGGRGVLEYIKYYARSVVAEARDGLFVFNGREHTTAVLNIPYVGVSEVGNALVDDGAYDIAMCWFERGDGMMQFSLRSNKEKSNVDVSAIAKYFGGGGHQNAAGFQVPVLEGRRIVDAVLINGLARYPVEIDIRGAFIPRSPGGCV